MAAMPPMIGRTSDSVLLPNGVLLCKSMGDCQHIAFATISGCDVIVSWNFKHMVRMTTIQKVRTINTMKGYFKLLDIVSPTVMLGDDADE